MKKIIAFFIIGCIFYCCQKGPSDNPVIEPRSANCRLTKIVQGVARDTVFLITYDDNGHISNIKDSIAGNKYSAAYDVNGRLTAISSATVDFSVTYNADGLPLKITGLYGGSYFGSQYQYEYDGSKQLVKRTQNTFDNGVWKPYSAKKYEFSNGDIIRTSEYSIQPGTDSLTTYSTDYTYTADANVFQPLSFFSEAVEETGLYEMLDIDFYFNKHMFKSSIYKGLNSFEYQQQYSRDSITGVFTGDKTMEISNGQSSNFTRAFFYDCK